MTIVDELPGVGLTMAFTSALGNVLGEVLRKRLVGSYNPGTVTFAYRLPTALFIGIVIVIMMRNGASPRVVDHGPVFGVWHLAPITGFLVYALVVTLILGIATWMHLKAFAVGELSTTAPILSFTPVFAVFTGWVAFHNVPSAAKLIGIVLVVIGAIAIHVDVLSSRRRNALMALLRDPGSRWMLGVCVLYAIVGPIERSVDDMSGPYLVGMVVAFGTAAMWFAVGVARGEDLRTIFIRRPSELAALPGSDAIVLITYYGAMASIPPVFMQTLRRAEVLIIVLMGWLIFKEKRIARKFLGSSIMVIGVIIIIVRNLTLTQTLWLAATGLAILIPLSLLALYGERRARRYDADTKQARSPAATPGSGPLV